ncbi:MAG: restriction endonuclease subunit S [Zoogloeaceae bacterium]|nr:restriction endonuclease subunit S [Zoogloeaceae bacterium]
MTTKPPPGWITTTIGEACSIRNDLRLPISREERATMEGPFPYYGPTGQLDAISNFRLDGTFALIGEDGDHFLDVEKKPQTILVSGKFNVNNHAHVVESTNQCGAEWFYNYFRHKSLRPFLTRQGAGRYKLNKAALQEVPIVLPPPEEQQAINALFREWDTAIQKTEQLIAAKERHQGALVQRLYALSDNRGSSSRFGDLLEESMEAGSTGRYARKITVKLYGKGVLAKEEKRQGSEQTQYFIRRAGQLIYSKLDFLNGAFGLVPPELDGYESTLDLPAFDIAPTVNPIWLIGYLTRPTYYTHQVGLARGQRKARRVHPSDLLASSLQVPPRDLQDRIARFFTFSQDDIDKSKRLLESLKAQKRGLMQKLLTGQWRLQVQEEAN